MADSDGVNSLCRDVRFTILSSKQDFHNDNDDDNGRFVLAIVVRLQGLHETRPILTLFDRLARASRPAQYILFTYLLTLCVCDLCVCCARRNEMIKYR